MKKASSAPPAEAGVSGKPGLSCSAGLFYAMSNDGTRIPGAPVRIGGTHPPSNCRAAPALPAWQFATSGPTNGALTFECDIAAVTTAGRVSGTFFGHFWIFMCQQLRHHRPLGLC